MRWEHFYHQADIGVRGVGATLEEAFEQAGLGLMGVVCDATKVQPKQEIEIRCECDDIELLLVDWLNAIIFEIATRCMLFCKFDVDIADGKLSGKAWGESADPERHETAVEVKGATYTELSVTRDDSGNWVVQCVVDV